MADIKKVIKGLEGCLNRYDCKTCPYATEYDPNFDCIDKTRKDAIELLKEQQAEIERLKAEKTKAFVQQVCRSFQLQRPFGSVYLKGNKVLICEDNFKTIQDGINQSFG